MFSHLVKTLTRLLFWLTIRIVDFYSICHNSLNIFLKQTMKGLLYESKGMQKQLMYATGSFSHFLTSAASTANQLTLICCSGRSESFSVFPFRETHCNISVLLSCTVNLLITPETIIAVRNVLLGIQRTLRYIIKHMQQTIIVGSIWQRRLQVASDFEDNIRLCHMILLTMISSVLKALRNKKLILLTDRAFHWHLPLLSAQAVQNSKIFECRSTGLEVVQSQPLSGQGDVHRQYLNESPQSGFTKN